MSPEGIVGVAIVGRIVDRRLRGHDVFWGMNAASPPSRPRRRPSPPVSAGSPWVEKLNVWMSREGIVGVAIVGRVVDGRLRGHDVLKG